MSIYVVKYRPFPVIHAFCILFLSSHFSETELAFFQTHSSVSPSVRLSIIASGTNWFTKKNNGTNANPSS